MVMRTIGPGMAPDIVGQIDARLARVEVEQGATILLAVESGSRAWGFPSPDSDYDCRFLFVRSINDYLSPWQSRDVIETPLDRIFDVNGWELGKALKLLLKGNAVVIEWLCSPIVYRGDATFRDGLLALARAHADRQMIGRHYLHLGERQKRTYFADTKAVALKKLFYALRPAAALRWMRMHPEAAVAPMHFPTLMAECDPPREVHQLTDELLARKAVSHEMGTGTLPPVIAAFIEREFELARDVFESGYVPSSPAARADAAALFRQTVLGAFQSR
jgi:hypothetical protein